MKAYGCRHCGNTNTSDLCPHYTASGARCARCRAADRQDDLCRDFELRLLVCLGQSDYPKCIASNRAEPDPRVCHSHDYCDANQTMLDAFTSTLGREPDLESDADCALITAAWDQWRKETTR